MVTAPIPDRLLGTLGDERRFRLTPPELRVLTCISHGMTYEMAANTLGVSRNTVISQRETAVLKLRAKTTTHAVAQAIRQGLIQ